MSKKIVLIVLISISVLVLAVGIYYKIKIAKLPIEQILPKGALCYVRISDIEKRMEEFKNSRLWHNIESIDIENLMEKSGLGQEELKQYGTLKSNFFSSLGELLLDRFFGQEIALALYPSEITTFDADTPYTIVSDFILVTRLKPEAEFAEFVARLFSQFDQKVQIEQEEYKGSTVSIVELSDKLNIAYVRARDLLIVSLGKKAVMDCIDVVAKARPSLSQDQDYLLASSKLPRSTETIAYGNFQLTIPYLKRLAEVVPEGEEEILKQRDEIIKSLNRMKGFKTIVYGSVPGRISKTKTILFFDRTAVDPSFAKNITFKPQKNSTTNFVPEDIISYQWSNCFNAKASWDDFKQQLSKQPKEFTQVPTPEERIRDIENRLGMSINDDIIPSLSNEIGTFIANVNLEGPFPIPEITFFIKVKDKAVIQNAIVSLVERDNFSLQSEEYKNVEIKYASLPFGMSLQPGFCFLDDYLLISTGRKPLKVSIDTFFSKKSMSLLANEDFKSIDFGLTDKNNAVFFLKTDMLLREIREICEWAFSWVTLMSANLQAQQQRSEQYLANVEQDIITKESELENLKANLQSAKEQMDNLQSQGLDISLKEQEIIGLQAKIEQQKEQLTLIKKDIEQRKGEVENMIQKSPLGRIDLALVRLYLDGFVYPILDGLQMVQAVGSRSTFGENMLEVQSFSKREE